MSTNEIIILIIAFSIIRIVLPVFLTLCVGELIRRLETNPEYHD